MALLVAASLWMANVSLAAGRPADALPPRAVQGPWAKALWLPQRLNAMVQAAIARIDASAAARAPSEGVQASQARGLRPSGLKRPTKN